MTITSRLLRMLLLLLLAPPASLAQHLDPAADTAAQQISERWYSVELSGERAGYVRSTRTTADGLITSAESMTLAVARGTITVEISASTEFVETSGGRPVSVRTLQSFGGTPQETTITFQSDGTMLVASGLGEPRTMKAPTPGWATPERTKQALREAIAAGQTSLELRAFDPLVSLAETKTLYTGFKPTTIDVKGEPIEVYKVETTVPAFPALNSTEFLSAEGDPVAVVTRMGGFELRMTLSDRATASGEVVAPELMVATFVRPSEPISRPRRSKAASFRLRITEGSIPDLPGAGAQRVQRLSDTEARVDQRVGRGSPASDSDVTEALIGTRMIPNDDQAILDLVEKARPSPDADPAVRAEALRRFVFNYVDAKSLGVAFAGAAEVARTREGDCTEHAVLLASMLRADGIPARVASGLVYADAFAGSENVFAYHMWTQAALPGEDGLEWIDLDATLGPYGAYDATHIALGVSTLPDDRPLDGMMDMVPLLGRLEIDVESVQ